MPQLQKKGKYQWPMVANATLTPTLYGLFLSLKLENLTAINAVEQTFATQFQAEVKKEHYEGFVAHGQAVVYAIFA